MRAVAFTVIFFIYIFSISAWFVDTEILVNSNITARALDGTPINSTSLVNEGSEAIRSLGEKQLNPENEGTILDRIGDFATTGYTSVWVLLELLSGTYAFNILSVIGLPDNFVLLIKLIFPILVAFTVIYYLVGRY